MCACYSFFCICSNTCMHVCLLLVCFRCAMLIALRLCALPVTHSCVQSSAWTMLANRSTFPADAKVLCDGRPDTPCCCRHLGMCSGHLTADSCVGEHDCLAFDQYAWHVPPRVWLHSAPQNMQAQLNYAQMHNMSPAAWHGCNEVPARKGACSSVISQLCSG